MSTIEEALTKGIVWAIGTVFVAGVATSLTPCVYPMIPITVSLFGARQARSRRWAFVLASCYVAGIAITYTSLGLLVALGGWAVGGTLTSHWFVVPLALVFATMATSMFGLWKMPVPHSLADRLSRAGGQGVVGAFVMGVVGGIIIAPCTGPILAGLLAYVATQRDVMLGGVLLLSYSLGIGVLFWLIATFSLRLPRAGRWMEAVQSSFGVIMLVAALFYLQNAVPTLERYASPSPTFLAVNMLLALAGVLLGGLHLTFRGTGWVRALRKAVGVALLTIGLWGLTNYATTPAAELNWVHEESAALTQAKAENRPLFIDFWARWCVPCKQLEAEVLSRPAVREQLERFVLFKADVSDDTERDRQLKRKYGAGQLPQLVVIDSQGRETARLGKASTDEILHVLRNTH